MDSYLQNVKGHFHFLPTSEGVAMVCDIIQQIFAMPDDFFNESVESLPLKLDIQSVSSSGFYCVLY